MYILELFTVDTDGNRHRYEEQYPDMENLRCHIFWEKLKTNIVGYKIYEKLKHENYLIESRWTVAGKKLWMAPNATH